MEVSIPEAARILDISERTVRRRLHSGEVEGRRVAMPQGFAWIVILPDDLAIEHDNGEIDEGETTTQQLVDLLTQQLAEKDRQIRELHVLLQQAQIALPAPEVPGRPWWKFWG